MARYYEGVNGSMQGTAGGVNVYNWRGLWLQRARRKSALSFVPTPKQRIVITNFTTMSQQLKPYAVAFKFGFPKTAAGMTSRATATKVNFARQMHQATSGQIIFDSSKVVVADGALGDFSITISFGRDSAVSLGWVKPSIDSPLYGAQICFLSINLDTLQSVFFTADSSAESANLSMASIATSGASGRVFVFARTLEGASVQILEDFEFSE